MLLERSFRLSNHITLGLSCVTLVYAEASFLPGLPVCLAPVLALLLVAWWVEGRWSLPTWGANVLGGLIAISGIVWLGMQLSEGDSWLALVSIPTAVVPYLGPLVMAALLVRLFRPRRPGDFWLLQGLGLLQVALGCVLASGPEFGILLAAYFASALICLALHYRRSAVGHPLPDGTGSLVGSQQPVSAWWLFPFTIRWTLAVGALALLLFLLTPRREGSAWEPLNRFRPDPNWPTHASAGLSEKINLNRTGTIELDDGEALQVAVTDEEGQPKRDLPVNQRWRGLVLDWYEGGKWTMWQLLPATPRQARRQQQQLPDFGPGQYFLTFTIKPRQAGGLVLADPIRFGPPSARLPVIPVSGTGRSILFFERSGTIQPLQFSVKREYQYRQVLPARADSKRTPAEKVPDAYLERLASQPVPGLEEWTIALLRRLSAQPHYRLPDTVRAALAGPKRSFSIEPECWEGVARVLTDYLAVSGEYTYTLELTRQDLTLDPVMDFLLNLKQGHCERYATALALMLRAVGIPSRVVKGFRGADNKGNGTYVVLHSHAHAWVEILVPRREPNRVAYDWLTLDPTPIESASAPDKFSLSHWWHKSQRTVLQLWQQLIVDYNADEQADLWDSLKPDRRLHRLLKLGLLLLASFAALLAFLLLRRLLQGYRAVRARSADGVAFYARLLALLARHSPLRLKSGQTPREFADTARQFFQTLPGLAVLADLPGRVVELFYRVRFGDHPLSEPERQALDAGLDQLAEALHQLEHSR